MRHAGRITAQARALAGSMVRPGVTTQEIDSAVRRFIRGKGGEPSFLNYGGFTGSACISVNQVVIHGIPSRKTVLREGDIVSIDVGAYVDGFHGSDRVYAAVCARLARDSALMGDLFDAEALTALFRAPGNPLLVTLED